MLNGISSTKDKILAVSVSEGGTKLEIAFIQSTITPAVGQCNYFRHTDA